MLDSELSEMFYRAVRDERIDATFYNMRMDSDDAFKSFFKQRGVELFSFVRDGELAGFYWLTNKEHRTAQIHFCFFKEAGKDVLRMGRLGLGYVLAPWVKGASYLDTVVGVTPSINRLAVKMLPKVGMRVVGEVPGMAFDMASGESVPAIISYGNLETLKEVRHGR